MFHTAHVIVLLKAVVGIFDDIFRCGVHGALS
jgi:hypothetical protein